MKNYFTKKNMLDSGLDLGSPVPKVAALAAKPCYLMTITTLLSL